MLGALGLAGCLAVWSAVADHYAHQGQSMLFPPPSQVAALAATYAGLAKDSRGAAWRATLWEDWKASAWRVGTAFLVSTVIAVPAGLLAGSVRAVQWLCVPAVEFFRYIPVPALIPVLILLFGIDETPKVLLIVIGTALQLFLLVLDEARRVPEECLRAARTLGASAWEVATLVRLPAAAPGIYDALRLTQGWAWTWLIVAELVAANVGMGFRIVRYQRFLQTDHIFLYLAVLGLTGLALDAAFRAARPHLFRWSHAA